MTKVLIIEDDNMLGDTLSLYLQGEGYDVIRVDNARDGLLQLQARPDILLLDLMLPDSGNKNPSSLMRQHTAIPIIVISSLTEVSERIRSLTDGADDYVCKPFSMQELKARIEAVLRRYSILNSSVVTEQESGISLDLARRTVLLNNQRVEMTFSEFEIMKLFILNPGKVYSRYALIEAIRGIDAYINDRTIDVHITKLRKKIEVNPKNPQYIQTIWGSDISSHLKTTQLHSDHHGRDSVILSISCCTFSNSKRSSSSLNNGRNKSDSNWRTAHIRSTACRFAATPRRE